MTLRGISILSVMLMFGCGDDDRGTTPGTDAGPVGSDASTGDSGSGSDAGPTGTDAGPSDCPDGEARPADDLPCEPVSCGSLSAPANGSLDVEDTDFGASASYDCDDGYMISGDAIRTCTADGTWSGSEPTCEVTDCGAPSAPANGSVSITGTGLGDTATYACEGTHRLLTGMHSVCTDDGWMGETPTCAPLLDCVCDSILHVGEKVVSTVSTPPDGTVGVVQSGTSSGVVPLGVVYESWTGGHDGNCGGSFTTLCGTCDNPGTSKYYMACSAVATLRLPCACDGVYTAGDRVVLLEDNPGSSTTLPAGTLGTVVAGRTSGGGLMLVEWDGWTDGHSGVCGNANCGECTASGSSRWWVACGELGLAP